MIAPNPVAERAAEISFGQLSCLHRDSIFHLPSTFIGIDGEGADQVPWTRTSRADAPDVGADRTGHKALGQIFLFKLFMMRHKQRAKEKVSYISASTRTQGLEGLSDRRPGKALGSSARLIAFAALVEPAHLGLRSVKRKWS